MATLDNSVADIADSVVEILSTNGDVYCGGSDIDKAIADYVVDTFKNENGIDLSNDSQAYARIYEAAEKAKCELSSSVSTEISLPYITVGENGPVHMNMTLTRAKFEQLASPIIDKVIKCGKKALEEAGLKSSDLNGILLVGGSCRIPLVQERLQKEFGVELIKNVNLDEAVALGAAIQGGILSGDSKSNLLLLDVTPLSLGIETMGGVMTKLVEANTTIPCSREQIFSTAVDNQPAVTIRCLQGERPMANDNKEIGVFNLDGIAPAMRGVPQILVKFDIDANGILKVSATDKATGKEQHITIENKGSLTQEEIDRIKADAEEHKAEDDKKKAEIEKMNHLESLIFTTEKSLDTYKDNAALTEEDKTYFNAKLEEMKKMQEDKDYSKMEELEKEVLARWNTVATKAYSANAANGQNGFDASQFGDMFNGATGQPQNESTTPNSDGFEEV